jgi:uncharacterized membrane protein YsdA (DUF1294 family)
MPSYTTILLVYAAVINLCGFFSMGIDKYKAMHHKWRISEKMLFFFAILGGSVGSILGMQIFRHKTKHWYFVAGMPAILIVQLLLLYKLFF